MTRPGIARGPEPVAVTGMAVTTAYGRGCEALLAGVLSGVAAFGEVTRFDVGTRRVRVAATMPGSPVLLDELDSVVEQACDQAKLAPAQRAETPLFLAAHGRIEGWRRPARTYTSACVAASTAVADAVSTIAHGEAERVVVAAGYLVEPDQFALFDAGRALAADGAVRPFSKGRKGLLLGDGVAAIVLEAAPREPLAWIRGWGRAGDAYHVCQPRPDGSGLARAVGAALRRAGVAADDVDYVNAHGSGSAQSDAAEASGLRAAGLAHAPVSSTKSLHGQSLEASPLVELITTVLAMNAGSLPVNAGFLESDPDCPLNLILGGPLARFPRYPLIVNSAFGGANTALLVGAA